MRNLQSAALVAVAALALTACNDDNPWAGLAGKGGISLRLKTDAAVKDAVPTRATETLEAPDASLFAIKAEKTDGSYTGNWNSITEFNNYEDGFSVGRYTVSASYGDIEKEGFDSPAYYGETEVMVLEGEPAFAEITATLANTMVSVDFTDAFKTYFEDYSVTLHSEGHSYQTVNSADTGRPVYLAPGHVELAVTITRLNGGKMETTTIQPADFDALARHHYHVTLDFNGGNVGEGQFSIIFDDSMTQEDVVIDLTDELFTAPVPTVEASGFTPGTAIELLRGGSADEAPRFTVAAYGKMAEAVLTVASSTYTPAWGREIDLLTASPSQQGEIAAAGLECIGFFRNPDRMARVDLSGFLANLPEGEHTVTLVVKDKVMHQSEPLSLTVKVLPVTIEATPQTAIFGSGEATVSVVYNGENPEKNITFRMCDDTGTMIDCPVISCTESKTRAVESKTYDFVIALAATENENVPLEVYYRGALVQTTTLRVTVPEYTVELADAFARYAVFQVKTDNAADLAAVTAKTILRIGGSVVPEANVTRDTKTGLIRIVNLRSATSYHFQTALLADASEYAGDFSFTTETETQLPNADFAETSNLSIGGLKVGGQYKVLVSYQHSSSINRTVPAGSWATLNPLTAYAGAANKNTWFIVPSTYLDGSEAIIRSVGYNHNGTTPSASSGATTYYCTNSPSQDQLEKAAGELFLGSYSFDGTANRADGVAFASRPTSLTFSYRYTSINGEEGEAYIRLLDAAGSVIAESDVALEASSSAKTMTVALPSYPAGRKAASVQVGFKSVKGSAATVNIPTGSALNEGQLLGNKTIAANSYHAFASGSELAVSGISLGYEYPGQAAAGRASAKKRAARR